MRELIARIRAILRRSENSPKEDETISNPEVLVECAVRLDLERHELSVDGDLVSLALREFELLSYLMENSGRVVTRESLMQNVWGWDYIGDTKTIDVHVKRLRSKIESDPSAPLRISTIRGVGYRYERSG